MSGPVTVSGAAGAGSLSINELIAAIPIAENPMTFFDLALKGRLQCASGKYEVAES